MAEEKPKEEPKEEPKAEPKAEETQQEPGKDDKKGYLSKLKDDAMKKGAEIGAKAQELGGQALESGKKKMEEAKQAAEDRLSMEGQLKAAAESLKGFLNPDLTVEDQIPLTLMKKAQGIVFLSVVKAGMGFGGAIGSGVIMAKLDYGAGWSGPCSIGLAGAQFGFNIGAQKTDFVIILRDEKAVKLFSGKGQIKFGADASIAAGPVGRDAQIAVGANDKGYAATVSYSQAKGLYVGVALEGQGIKVREDCNEKYYGKKLEVKDILGAAQEIKNEDYDKIVELLTNYTAQIDEKAADKEANKDDNKQPL